MRTLRELFIKVVRGDEMVCYGALNWPAGATGWYCKIHGPISGYLVRVLDGGMEHMCCEHCIKESKHANPVEEDGLIVWDDSKGAGK